MRKTAVLIIGGVAALFLLFSCGSDLSVDIPNIIEYVEIEVPTDEKGDVGGTIKVKEGVPNVIVQYVNQDYSEFVRPEDGKVKYIVYNEHKEPAPDAIVTGLPGIVGENRFEADEYGVFYVFPDKLPENKPISVRTVPNGSTTGPKVEYTNSVGVHVRDVLAATTNIYVPNRMHVRVSLNDASGVKYPVLDGAYMVFPAISVQRNDKDQDKESDWELIPEYLGAWNKNITAFGLDNKDDPGSYESGPPLSRKQYTISPTSIKISSITKDLKVTRLRKRTNYFRPVTAVLGKGINEYDPFDTKPYFTFVLDSFYGEKAKLDAVIKMAPIQIMPTLSKVEWVGPYNPSTRRFEAIKGELDIAHANLDYNLFFKRDLKRGYTNRGKTYYDYFEPDPEPSSNYTKINDALQFTVQFSAVLNKVTYGPIDRGVSIFKPSFSINSVYMDEATPSSPSNNNGTSVELNISTSASTNHYFYRLATMGYFKFNNPTNSGDTSTDSLIIYRRTAYVDGTSTTGWAYYLLDSSGNPVDLIPVTPAP